MNKIRLLFMLAAVTTTLAAAEPKAEKPPPLPEEVRLTNGATLHHVSVVRWEKDRVVLKHSGGIDPIRYTNLAPEERAIFEIYRAALVPMEEAKQAAERKAQASQQTAEQIAAQQEQIILAAIANKSVIPGMTRRQVVQAWGNPLDVTSIDASKGSHITWTYEKYLVHFESGLVTSWTNR